MKKLSVVVLALVLATACAGKISERKSTFDNSREVTMEPAYVFRHTDGRSGSDIQFSLFWRSTMPTGTLILEAFATGAHSIPSENSLHFNVDGKIVSFSSIDTLTDIETKYPPRGGPPLPVYNISSKRYVVTFDFIEKIITADDVRVKLDLGRKYVEGIFSDDTFGAAKPAFVKFYEQIKAQP